VSRTPVDHRETLPFGSDRVRAEAADWLLRVEASEDPAVLGELAQWLSASPRNREAYRSVERMWKVAGALPPVAVEPQVATADPGSAGRSASGRSRVFGRSRRRSGTLPPRRRIVLGAVAVAAACLLLALAPELGLRLDADYRTGIGETERILLGDGSIVHLDADSAVAIDYEAGRRRVALLDGRAFFDVAVDAGRPFEVEVDGLRVRVTGTAFSVAAFAERFVVSVRSGSVAVETQEGLEAAHLTSGDRLTVRRADGQLTRVAVAAEEVGAWRDGRLPVDGRSLAEVVEELDRRYPGRIVLRDEALGERRVTGLFDLSRPVEALRAAVGAQGGSVTAFTPFLLLVSGPER
jgi:transmembrane sensor